MGKRDKKIFYAGERELHELSQAGDTEKFTERAAETAKKRPLRVDFVHEEMFGALTNKKTAMFFAWLPHVDWVALNSQGESVLHMAARDNQYIDLIAILLSKIPPDVRQKALLRKAEYNGRKLDLPVGKTIRFYPESIHGQRVLDDLWGATAPFLSIEDADGLMRGALMRKNIWAVDAFAPSVSDEMALKADQYVWEPKHREYFTPEKLMARIESIQLRTMLKTESGGQSARSIPRRAARAL